MDFKPGYYKLWQEGILQARIGQAKELYSDCTLCPRNCRVDRSEQAGICGALDRAVVASFGPHLGEERVLVGFRGSGTIFFGHCNLRCVFCQNHELSFEGEGQPVTAEELGEIMLLIQDRYHCHNLNLVTPTHFIPSILAALGYAVKRGLRLPLVYNCGGYESLEALALLDGVVDIYMPDFKYLDSERARTLSGAADYPDVSKQVLLEMDRQVGGLQTNRRGIAQRGLLIRHLMLPGGLEDTKEILTFIKENLSADCLVNLMTQYRPEHRAFEYPEINRPLPSREFQGALEYAQQLGLRLA